MRLQIPRRTKNKKVPPAWKQKRQPSVFFPPHLIFAHGLELCGEGVCVLGVAQQGPPLLQALVQHRRLQLLVVLVEPCTIKDNTLISKIGDSLLFASLRVRISASISAILAGMSPLTPSSSTWPAPSSSTTTPRLLLRRSSASLRLSSTSRLSSWS